MCAAACSEGAHMNAGSSPTVCDRRGRGESTDVRSGAVGWETLEREVEDLDALMDQLGGPALVWGHSSGAALALQAAVRLGGKVRGLAMDQPRFNDDGVTRRRWRTYRAQLDQALAAGDTGARRSRCCCGRWA
nr:alpha/beta hydrolase [Deinococcus aerophilus]